MKRFLLLSLIAVTSSIILYGCATIFGYSGPETVNIRSTPDQATITIIDEVGTKIFEGKTPTETSLEKDNGFFSGKTYTLTISKEGYVDKTITIDTEVNGWYIGGNCLFGGLIGWLIVDPATGAMWTLDTNEIDVTLETNEQGLMQNSNTTRIVLLQDVPPILRDKMVRITK